MPAVKSDKKIIRIIIILGLYVVTVGLFGYYHHHYVRFHSDATTTFPMALDILKGNMWLHDWVLGTNNFYFTDIVVCAIGKLLGFSSYTLLCYLPGLMWTTLYFMMMLFLNSEIKRYENGKLFFYVMTGCTILAIDPITTYTLLNANMHTALYAYLAIYLVLLSGYIDKGIKQCLWVATLLAVLMSFSDSMTTMVLFAPMMCVSIIMIFKNKRFWAVAISLVISFIGAKGIYILFDIFDGMETRGIPVGLADLSTLGQRFLEWTKQLSVFFGMDNGYWEAPWDMHKVIATIYMILLVVALVYFSFRFWKVGWKIKYLLGAVAVNILGCLLTNVGFTYRYLVITYYYGYILVALLLMDIVVYKPYKYILIPVYVVLFGNLVFLRICEVPSNSDVNASTRELARFIADNDLGNGYAEYWSASVTSFFTDFEDLILPVGISKGTGIEGYIELIKHEWYATKDIHYVITFANEAWNDFIDIESLKEVCGEPDDIYEVSEYIIWRWNKDISDYLVNGISDGRLTPFELGQNENTMVIDGVEYLYKDAVVYGPYTKMEPGIYRVQYTGDNMDILSFDIWSVSNNKAYEISDVYVDDNSITYLVNIDEEVNDLEFRLFNSSDEVASYMYVDVEKVS